MKSRTSKDEEPHDKGAKSKSSIPGGSDKMMMATRKNKMKKNMRRLGGGGLSLEAFANIKSNRNQYNPALIKKQREFYKNAKYISKYKKSKKQLSQPNYLSLVTPLEDRGEVEESSKQKGKNKKKGSQSLRELYEKKRQEDEKARMEREAIARAKTEEKERAEARRKAEREKMLKRTWNGQPVMKYRIEHLLQTIQGSS